VAVQPLRVPSPNCPPVPGNAASASAALAKTRSPILLLRLKNPNRCVRLTRGRPARPRLVVMMTTPFEARPP